MKKYLFLFVICFCSMCMAHAMTLSAMAAGGVIVSDIQPVYVEKGTINYTVTMRAIVTNNTDNENVAFDVSGVDKDGYILENLTLTGKIKPGSKRVVMKRFTLPKKRYEKIVKWVEKK